MAGYTPEHYGPEVRRGGGLPFGQFVSQWGCDPRYSTNARTLYIILVTYADVGARDTSRGKPYRAELAAQLGCSESTLDRTLYEGVCAGLWHIEEQAHVIDGKRINDANIYHLHDAAFWRGEWTDPLAPGQSAADVAKERLAKRRAAKRAAGIKAKGGRRQESLTAGVASPMTPPPHSGGGVTHDATPGVMGDAGGGVMGDAHVYSPEIKNPSLEPWRPSVRPSAQVADAHGTDGRTDGGGGIGAEVREQVPGPDGETAAADAAPEKRSSGGEGGQPAPVPGARQEMTPGAEVLYRIGRMVPTLAVAGQVLTDQAARLDHLLSTSAWTRSDLMAALSVAPPEVIRTSAGAVMSARITALPATPVSVRPSSEADQSSTATADRSVAESVHRRIGPECRECGRPAESGLDLCGECAGWPVCDQERCTHRVPVPGTCATCELYSVPAPTPAGVCEGHDGTGCGAPVMEAGPLGLLCGRCEFRARRARAEADAEWDAARAAAVEAARAEEAARAV